MTVIDTSTLATGALRYGRGKIAQDSAGRYWVGLIDATTPRLEFWYSTNLTSWTENTSARITLDASANGFSFDILQDTTDRALLIVYKEDSTDPDNYTDYYFVSGLSTSFSWGSADRSVWPGGSSRHSLATGNNQVSEDADGYLISLEFYPIWTGSLGNNYALLTRWNKSTGAWVDNGAGFATFTTKNLEASIVGDVAIYDGGTDPVLWAVASGETSVGDRIELFRGTWGGSSWSWDSRVNISTTDVVTQNKCLALLANSTGCIIVTVQEGATSTVKVERRNAANTSTSNLSAPSLSDGVVRAVAIAPWNEDGDADDFAVYAVGTTSGDVSRVVYDDSASSWGSWETVVAPSEAVLVGNLGALKRHVSDSVPIIYVEGNSSPYDIVVEEDGWAVIYTMSASGSATSSGSLDVRTTRPISMSGSTATAGSLAEPIVKHGITMSGATASTGSLDIDTTRPLSGTGSTSTTGSLDVRTTRPISMSGAVTTTGSADLLTTRPMSASGSTSTTGSLDILATRPLSSTGSTATAGSLNILTRRPLAASGSTATTGSLDILIGAPVSATGSTTTAGSLAEPLVAHALAATGSTTCTGSVNILTDVDLTASGSATTTGSLDIDTTRPISSTGSTTSAGVLNVGITLWLTSTGTTTTTGSVNILTDVDLAASGSASTTGALDVTVLRPLTSTGASTTSGSLAIGLPPQVPLNLVATPVSDTEVGLVWDDNVFGATAWDIERDGSIIEFDWLTNSYTDSGLDPETTYEYRVRAVVG